MEMELKISSDNYDIVKTGTIMTFDKDANINFICDLKSAEFKFEIEFKFVNTETNEIGLEKRIEGNNRIIMECKNFNNMLGTGTTIPVDLATISNKKLYINFCMTRLENGPRIMHYTFYIEK